MRRDGRDGPRVEEVPQELPRADARQLVGVPHEEKGGPLRHRLEEGAGEEDVDHRDLVDDDEVGLDRVVAPAPEAARRRVHLEEAVDRPRLHPRTLGEPLRRASGRRGEGDPERLGEDDPQERVDERRLADARPARQDEDLRAEEGAHGGALARGEHDSRPRLHPRDRRAGVRALPGRGAGREGRDPLGHDPLGGVERGEEDAGPSRLLLGDEPPVAELQAERLDDLLTWSPEELGRAGDERLPREAAVPLVERLGQDVRDTGADADHRVLGDAEAAGERVGRDEADPPHVPREAVGVLGDDGDRVGAVGPEDPHGTRRPDPVGVEEDHDLPHSLLLGPARHDPLSAERRRRPAPRGDGPAPSRSPRRPRSRRPRRASSRNAARPP